MQGIFHENEAKLSYHKVDKMNNFRFTIADNQLLISVISASQHLKRQE